MRALLAAVVLVIAVGCADDVTSEAAGEGVGREVAVSTIRPTSLSGVRFASAVGDLRALPALHVDFEVTAHGETAGGWLERDGASSRWRAGIGEDAPITSGDLAALEPGLRMALHLAALDPPLDSLVGAGTEQTLASRAGPYGIEAGSRIVAAGGTIEYWISEDSGLLTTIVVDERQSVVLRFTPLPAALVISSSI